MVDELRELKLAVDDRGVNADILKRLIEIQIETELAKEAVRQTEFNALVEHGDAD